MTTASPPRRPPIKRTHPVNAYALAVVAGKIVAGRKVRLACARHLRDLEHGHERGLYFDYDKADDAITFYGVLQLAEGEHAGHSFDLELWQMFCTGCLFGWMGPDGYRRFRDAYIEIAKGNGKSPWAAGAGLYLLAGDGEAGAEVYSAAVTREQAGISYRDAKLMAEASPGLARRLSIMERNIAYPATNSFFRPVSSEHRGLDGKRVHGAIIDEIHEHPTSLVVDKMGAGTKGRRQAMIIRITNSGYDRTSVCFQNHEMSVRILEGVIENDAWFAYIAGLDPCESCRAAGHDMPQENCEDCDDWRDEATWLKANPNLGVSITLKYLRMQVAEALGMPAKQNLIKRLNFCIWTQSVTRWLTADFWERGSTRGAALKGRPCFAGLHATVDSASLVLWFPDPENGGGDALSWFFVPQELLADAEKTHGVPWSVWADDGYVDVTEGDVTDYETLRSRLNELHEQYDIQEVGVFRHGTVQLQTQLEGDGLTVVPMSNGFPSMAGACEEVERLLKLETLRHGGNPVLRWQASNLSIKTNPEQQKRPDQESSGGPIGGMLALLMAMGRGILHQDEDQTSVYDERGFISI